MRKLVFLPAKKELSLGDLALSSTNLLWQITEDNLSIAKNIFNCQPYHLYVLGDEDIYEGEWCFEIHKDYERDDVIKYLDEKDPTMAWWLRELNMNYVKEPNNVMFNKTPDGSCLKVIETTNKDLGLPSPSNDLIRHFGNEYNLGKEIIGYDETLMRCSECGAIQLATYYTCQYPLCGGNLKPYFIFKKND